MMGEIILVGTLWSDNVVRSLRVFQISSKWGVLGRATKSGSPVLC